MSLRFDNRVVLITGAGAGLGREYALAFAERGGKIVVNDLGGNTSGDGASSRAADLVVEEIRNKGGSAVANYDSVENGANIVQCALDNFGSLDIVINNAGILRDKSFTNISSSDWNSVLDVHLNGAFKVTQAAWPHLRKNKYGRIIMTTSGSGLFGNFGQSNYASAKMGLVGLSQTLAIEGKKYNIKSNAVAPIAGTRLSASVIPDSISEIFKPQYLVPLILWLCHEECQESGSIFESAGGWIGKLRWQITEGALFNADSLSPELIRDHWHEVIDFTKNRIPEGNASETSEIVNRIQNGSSISGQMLDDTEHPFVKNIGLALTDLEYSFTAKDCILYALSVGVSLKKGDNLKFLYEGAEDFSVIPTFATLLTFSMNSLFTEPSLDIDLSQVLHGEHYLELFKPLPPSGALTSNAVISDIVDKGKGALLIVDVTTYSDTGEKLVFNQAAIYVKGKGGFGGNKASSIQIQLQNSPKRPPDNSVTEQTSIDQAAIHRLCGDFNPLHIDPSFASLGGFSSPILHGLASYAYACRHILEKYANNDVTHFKAIKARFSSPVLPGQTIQTDMWKEELRIYFNCKVVETGKFCLTGGYIDLFPSVNNNSSNIELEIKDLPSNEVDDIFTSISQRLSSKLVADINCIFVFEITENNEPVSVWTVDLKNGDGAVYKGPVTSGKADCTLILGKDIFCDLALGKLNGQKAFLTGKLKIRGNMMLAQKIGKIFQEQSKL